MEDPALSLSCSQTAESSLRVLAVSENGQAYVWTGASVAKLLKSQPSRVVVARSKGQASASREDRDLILMARLLESGAADNILVARGSTAKPRFETVSVERQAQVVQLPEELHGSLLREASRGRGALEPSLRSEGNATILGPESTANTMVRPTVASVDGPKAVKKRRAAPHLEGDVALSEARQETAGLPPPHVPSLDTHTPGQCLANSALHHDFAGAAESSGGEAMDVEGEQTLGEKLAAMGLTHKSVEDTTTSRVDAPRADSLQVLLSQALQSDDNSLLERCLAVVDEKVIDARLSVFKPMLALSGRLDLIAAQLKAHGLVDEAKGTEDARLEDEEEEPATTVFEDADSDVSLEDVTAILSGSEVESEGDEDNLSESDDGGSGDDEDEEEEIDL
eukprot:SM000065S20254  [mRNA]  locus=s65:644366:646706:- [translate_table: standard]